MREAILFIMLIGSAGAWYKFNVVNPQAELKRLSPLYKEAVNANSGLAIENAKLKNSVDRANRSVVLLQVHCRSESEKKKQAAESVDKSRKQFESELAQDKSHGPQAMNGFYKRLRAHE